jgi:hypothetical protein
MDKVDQFESVFKAAAKRVFVFERVPIRKILVVASQGSEGLEWFGARARALLRTLDDGSVTTWEHAGDDAFSDVDDLLKLLDDVQPDLICTHRHLRSSAWTFRHSLGEYLDILLQQTALPVVVLPHPEQKHLSCPEGTHTVMAITDHLAGEDHLINVSVRFTEPEGTLHLVHVENKVAFERIMDAISKIPSLDTDQARTEITERLMKEPRDFLATCRVVLEENDVHCRVEEIITMGRRLVTLKNLVQQRSVDLLVMNTKDEDQLAMHGLAYPLAVELTETPLLML